VGEAGIGRDSFDAQMDTLADYAMNDTQMLTASRCPSDEELRRLFEYAYEGKPVDFSQGHGMPCPYAETGWSGCSSPHVVGQWRR
jgi:hypothetical protein